MNPIILAELIAAKHQLHPNAVFIAHNAEFAHVRAEWVFTCMRLGLLPNEIKEISGWTQKRFDAVIALACNRT